MEDSRGARDGGRRIDAPPIGSFAIRAVFVLCALVGAALLFTACEWIDAVVAPPASHDYNEVNISDAKREWEADIWSGTDPAKARENAVAKYGNRNIDEVVRRLGDTPSEGKVPPPAAGSAPQPGAPVFRLYEEPPPGDAAVTVTHGPLPAGWAPDEELQKGLQISEPPLLFLAKETPGYSDDKTKTLYKIHINLIVGSTKGSEVDFRQGRLGFWGPFQAGSISATQLGPYRALLMQNGSGSSLHYYYYVPLAEGMSGLIYVPRPGADNSPPEAIAQGEALVSETKSIAQGLRFQVNGKPAP